LAPPDDLEEPLERLLVGGQPREHEGELADLVRVDGRRPVRTEPAADARAMLPAEEAVDQPAEFPQPVLLEDGLEGRGVGREERLVRRLERLLVSCELCRRCRGGAKLTELVRLKTLIDPRVLPYETRRGGRRGGVSFKRANPAHCGYIVYSDHAAQRPR